MSILRCYGIATLAGINIAAISFYIWLQTRPPSPPPSSSLTCRNCKLLELYNKVLLLGIDSLVIMDDQEQSVHLDTVCTIE
jgi:hypothetical protein